MSEAIRVFGEPLETLPRDLYIPPEALRVWLESFEGPLDLLLYLIRKHRMDVRDIQMTVITEQYLAYMQMMQDQDISLAAEYLLMAATLTEIKARMLLPQPEEEDGEDLDPRAALVDRLLIYERTVKCARALAKQPQRDNGFALSDHFPPPQSVPLVKPQVEVSLLEAAMARLIRQQRLSRDHVVEEEVYSLGERVAQMEQQLHHDWQQLSRFYSAGEGRGGVVVSLMAMLELDRARVLQWRQEKAFADIHLRLRDANASAISPAH